MGRGNGIEIGENERRNDPAFCEEMEKKAKTLREDTERRKREGLPPRPGSFREWKLRRQKD